MIEITDEMRALARQFIAAAIDADKLNPMQRAWCELGMTVANMLDEGATIAHPRDAYVSHSIQRRMRAVHDAKDWVRLENTAREERHEKWLASVAPPIRVELAYERPSGATVCFCGTEHEGGR